MKLWICVLLMAGIAPAAGQNEQKERAEQKDQKDQKEKPAAKQQSNRAVRRAPAALFSVPSDAQETAPGTWKHEADGKTWIYRQTPFGIVRFEEKQAARFETTEETKAADAAPIRAFDDGEFVRFERTGPFGVYKWRRNKKELNETERRALERAKAGQNDERK